MIFLSCIPKEITDYRKYFFPLRNVFIDAGQALIGGSVIV